MKTHYRKAFNSPYLSAADVIDAMHLTVAKVIVEPNKRRGADSPEEEFNVLHFVEKELRPGEALKPMILNVTNCKFLATLSDSKFIDDWRGFKVAVWVDRNVQWDKDVVEGLRLARPEDHPVAPAKLIAEAEAAASKGVASYSRWLKAATEETRLVLEMRLDGLKAKAKAADVAAKLKKVPA